MEKASGTGLERGGHIRQRSEPEVSQRDQYWGRQWVRGNSEPASLWASDEDAAWALLQAFEHISHYVRKGISNAMSCTHGGGILNVTQTFIVFCIQGQWGRGHRAGHTRSSCRSRVRIQPHTQMTPTVSCLWKTPLWEKSPPGGVWGQKKLWKQDGGGPGRRGEAEWCPIWVSYMKPSLRVLLGQKRKTLRARSITCIGFLLHFWSEKIVCWWVFQSRILLVTSVTTTWSLQWCWEL